MEQSARVLSEANVEKLNAPLYIDVVCYGCKRRVALSNTNEIDGRRYCNRCVSFDQDVEVE